MDPMLCPAGRRSGMWQGATEVQLRQLERQWDSYKVGHPSCSMTHQEHTGHCCWQTHAPARQAAGQLTSAHCCCQSHRQHDSQALLTDTTACPPCCGPGSPAAWQQAAARAGPVPAEIVWFIYLLQLPCSGAQPRLCTDTLAAMLQRDVLSCKHTLLCPDQATACDA